MIGSNLDNSNGASYPDIGSRETELRDRGLNFGVWSPVDSASLGRHRVNAIWAVHGERTLMRTRHSRTNHQGGVRFALHAFLEDRVYSHHLFLLQRGSTFHPPSPLQCTEFWFQRLNVEEKWDLFHAIRDTRDCMSLVACFPFSR
jgi:hypothetical protein